MRSRDEQAFTLLEVMIAVAVLGILYTVLAGVAMQGLRAEGEADRRLEAGLMADERVAQLEAAIAAGAPLNPASEETELDGYVVSSEITAYELALPPLEPKRGGAPEPDPNAPSFIVSGKGGGVTSLRRIDIRVAWQEGGSELAVVRTSYALDAVAAKPLIDTLSQAAAQEEESSDEESTDDTSVEPDDGGQQDGGDDDGTLPPPPAAKRIR